jgi:5-methylcytosine-specific restriction endonuclease McrA
LDKEFKDLVTKNCHYCGLIPSRKIKSESKHSTFTCNGIDRKDNSKGYIKENCVPCCEKCNIMKYTYSEKEFLDQCSLIARQGLLRSSFV